MLWEYFHSIKNRVKTSALDEQANIIRLVSLVSATILLEREWVLLECKIIPTTLCNTQNKRITVSDEEYKMIPKDPVMLLSFLNLKLRDFYKSDEELYEDLDLDRKETEEKLAGIGYFYDKERNQFV